MRKANIYCLYGLRIIYLELIKLLDTFKRGEDFHGFIAKTENNLTCDANDVKTYFPELRQAAKSFSFRVLYALELSHPVLQKLPGKLQVKHWFISTAHLPEWTFCNKDLIACQIFTKTLGLNFFFFTIIP